MWTIGKSFVELGLGFRIRMDGYIRYQKIATYTAGDGEGIGGGKGDEVQHGVVLVD